ncbi:MAG: hypothetical protein A3F33_02010 [Candidatus Woykebacteria bacterium RIFCSPHIGHO2_12_FULL_43_10]|uniref:Uncharacterized protein n=2 Tax=Candidatus Woykeibacteriota TaxID=1817899 RepID=A0A1G1WYM7_9BACT|nr:MAG: hypothetical protein A3F33_02010 [Candidatus Woykebacteria bacterium RIFCSPHIGHO2_12_FULL_43_10]OGY29464.1 MAG: hypothetical protein A3J50_00665 [Candidatus Woykebacteria bacterium RIFCSPHIGHO2_02_FULL_43_16b]OGY32868.1 MAG: hypothetical protein A3A61_03920 [Candidatus Woykebacteria bacterium RIFCSPLOWO2_01_FULL_43_14]
MNKDQLQEAFREVLFDFWEKVIEPVMVTKSEHEEIRSDLTGRIDRIDKKLDAEVAYRDRLEKRVKKIETKVGVE